MHVITTVQNVCEVEVILSLYDLPLRGIWGKCRQKIDTIKGVCIFLERLWLGIEGSSLLVFHDGCVSVSVCGDWSSVHW